MKNKQPSKAPDIDHKISLSSLPPALPPPEFSLCNSKNFTHVSVQIFCGDKLRLVTMFIKTWPLLNIDRLNSTEEHG